MGLRFSVRQLEGEVEELTREVGRLRLASADANGTVDHLDERVREVTSALWAVFARGKAGTLEALMTKLEAL